MDSSTNWIKLNNKIKSLRRERGLTQEQMAELLKISASHYKKIEAPNVNKNFTLDIIFRISEVLDVELIDIFNFN